MTEDAAATRAPLTRERVLDAAMSLADRDGLDALTMRAIGGRLGVSAMSLYRHVTDKEALLEGLVERVLTAIGVPAATDDWRVGLRRRAWSQREVLMQHSWAIGLIESRGTMGPAALRQAEAVLGSLRSAGFAVPDAAHAFWLLDSFVYGHVLQEAAHAAASERATSRPDDVGSAGDDGIPDDDAAARALAGLDPVAHPHLDELGRYAARHPFEIGRAFEVGLELVLDAVASMADHDR